MNFADIIAQKAADKVAQYALGHRLDIETVRAIAAGTQADMANNPCRVAHLPGGYVVVYAIEQHPGGWISHVRISHDGMMPPLIEMAMAIAKFVIGPNLPEKLRQSDVLIYKNPDGRSLNIMAPFVERPEKPVITITA